MNGKPPPDPARTMRLVLPPGIVSKPATTVAPRATVAQPDSGKPRKKGERIDWEAAEPLYRAGVLTDREIGKRLGCTHTAVQKHAREHGWDRDISARVAARVETKVAKAQVAREVAVGNMATTAVLIEAAADAIVRVKMEQRTGFKRLRDLSVKLFTELEAQVHHRESLENIVGEALFGDVILPATAQRLMQMLAFEGSVDSLAKLTAVFNTLTEMERKAFKLDTAVDGSTGRMDLPIRFVDAPRQLEGGGE